MNHLDRFLKTARRDRQKIVCAFLTLGFPSLKATEKLIVEFEKAGVGILELGFPFSDPLADGPTIQSASEYSLKRHVRLRDAFELVARLRRRGSKIPIIFFSYFNPIYHAGIERLAGELRRSGFDGAIIPDLIPDEAAEVERAFRRKRLSLIHLIAPTTERKRMAWVAKKSHGFIYYVSLKGVTGARRALPADLQRNIRALKRLSGKPVLVGFGVSSARQVSQITRFADGVVVGSVIIDSLKKQAPHLGRTVSLVRSFVRAAGRGRS